MATSFSPTPILHSHNLAGHSRESHMQRSSTPPHTVRYTRTGRVSKATKGQRVHGCEECGKVCTGSFELTLHAVHFRHKKAFGLRPDGLGIPSYTSPLPLIGRTYLDDKVLT